MEATPPIRGVASDDSWEPSSERPSLSAHQAAEPHSLLSCVRPKADSLSQSTHPPISPLPPSICSLRALISTLNLVISRLKPFVSGRKPVISRRSVPISGLTLVIFLAANRHSRVKRLDPAGKKVASPAKPSISCQILRMTVTGQTYLHSIAKTLTHPQPTRGKIRGHQGEAGEFAQISSFAGAHSYSHLTIHKRIGK